MDGGKYASMLGQILNKVVQRKRKTTEKEEKRKHHNIKHLELACRNFQELFWSVMNV